MEMLPFILAGVGILIFAVLGFAYYQNERLKKQLIDQAHQQLKDDIHVADILKQLQGSGAQELQAVKILNLAQQRIDIDFALELLQQGKTEDEAKAELVNSGIKPEAAVEALGSAQFRKFCLDRPVLSMMLGIVLPLLGLALIAGGLFLWLGNKSGRFVTFPFSGQLTIGIGVTLFALGAKMFLRSMWG